MWETFGDTKSSVILARARSGVKLCAISYLLDRINSSDYKTQALVICSSDKVLRKANNYIKSMIEMEKWVVNVIRSEKDFDTEERPILMCTSLYLPSLPLEIFNSLEIIFFFGLDYDYDYTEYISLMECPIYFFLNSPNKVNLSLNYVPNLSLHVLEEIKFTLENTDQYYIPITTAVSKFYILIQIFEELLAQKTLLIVNKNQIGWLSNAMKQFNMSFCRANYLNGAFNTELHLGYYYDLGVHNLLIADYKFGLDLKSKDVELVIVYDKIPSTEYNNVVGGKGYGKRRKIINLFQENDFAYKRELETIYNIEINLLENSITSLFNYLFSLLKFRLSTMYFLTIMLYLI